MLIKANRMRIGISIIAIACAYRRKILVNKTENLFKELFSLFKSARIEAQNAL